MADIQHQVNKLKELLEMGFISEADYHRRLQILGIEPEPTNIPIVKEENRSKSESDISTSDSPENITSESFACPCGFKVKTYFREDHKTICKSEEINCPNECEQVIVRGDLSKHLLNCEKAIVICKIVDKGKDSFCGMEVLRKNLEEHGRETHRTHMDPFVENILNEQMKGGVFLCRGF